MTTLIAPALFYDYQNQAWVQGGIYVDCTHPTSMQDCCYARAHQGERCTQEVLQARATLEQLDGAGQRAV